ncbi:MAG TPA: type IV pilin [Thermoplasmata archaeon]|nr:type IV pilin [Thermoplasmata archaeon]
MLQEGSNHRFLNGKGGRLGYRGRLVRSRRAVSEVIATILLLAMTVVLFSSIFAWVSAFPAPPAQNSNQFQARLTVTPNATGTGGFITAVSITHLAGPPVSSQTSIYVRSKYFPTSSQYTGTYTLPNGNVTGNTWNLGQTWLLTSFVPTGSPCTAPCHPYAFAGSQPDTISVYIYYDYQVLFTVALPVATTSQSFAFLSTGTTPAVPVIGGPFAIWASIQGVVPGAGTSVTAILSGLPGLSTQTTPVAMTYSAATGQWSYSISLGSTTAAGTYYVPITATTTAGYGWSGTSAVPVYITPYSTLIGSVFTMGTPVAASAKCTAAATPVAACQAANDYYYKITITGSPPLTFGNVLFEVLTSTRTVYDGTTHGAFAVALSTTLTTVAASYVTASPYAMQMPTSGFSTFGGALTTSSPLTTSYIIEVDVGTVNPAGTGLNFLVLGVGPYTSYVAVALP